MYQCVLNAPLEQSNIFTSTWFSSTQNSCITKFVVDFCGKIRRAHTVLARSKMQEKQNFLNKKTQCLIGERFHISLSYIYFISYICIIYIIFIILYIYIYIYIYIDRQIDRYIIRICILLAFTYSRKYINDCMMFRADQFSQTSVIIPKTYFLFQTFIWKLWLRK